MHLCGNSQNSTTLRTIGLTSMKISSGTYFLTRGAGPLGVFAPGVEALFGVYWPSPWFSKLPYAAPLVSYIWQYLQYILWVFLSSSGMYGKAPHITHLISSTSFLWSSFWISSSSISIWGIGSGPMSLFTTRSGSTRSNWFDCGYSSSSYGPSLSG